jgi:hypothetical protein
MNKIMLVKVTSALAVVKQMQGFIDICPREDWKAAFLGLLDNPQAVYAIVENEASVYFGDVFPGGEEIVLDYPRGLAELLAQHVMALNP